MLGCRGRHYKRKWFKKDRLYVALYARGGQPTMSGGEDKYHWAFIVGPKIESGSSRGSRYHAKESVALVNGRQERRWTFEDRDIRMAPTLALMVRVLVGKVRRRDRLVSVLNNVPMRPERRDWTCVSWVKEGLEALAADGKVLGTAVTDWMKIRDAVMQYVQQKEAEHRFDGLSESGEFEKDKVPTFDMMEGQEITA